MKPQASGGGIAWAALLLLLIASTWLYRTSSVQTMAGKFFGWIERPFLALGTTAKEKNVLFFSTRAELIDTVLAQDEQLTRLAQTASAWDEARRLYEDGEARLGYRPAQAFPQRATRILLRLKSGSDHRLLIDRGAEDGLLQGDPVLSPTGALIGTLAVVGKETAQVRLLSSPDSTVSISVVGEQRTLGIVQGDGGAILPVGFVEQGIELAAQALVVTSGGDDRIPRGLVVGTIQAVEKDPTAPFASVWIEPLADPDALRSVTVISSGLR